MKAVQRFSTTEELRSRRCFGNIFVLVAVLKNGERLLGATRILLLLRTNSGSRREAEEFLFIHCINWPANWTLRISSSGSFVFDGVKIMVWTVVLGVKGIETSKMRFMDWFWWIDVIALIIQ